MKLFLMLYQLFPYWDVKEYDITWDGDSQVDHYALDNSYLHNGKSYRDIDISIVENDIFNSI